MERTAESSGRRAYRARMSGGGEGRPCAPAFRALVAGGLTLGLLSACGASAPKPEIAPAASASVPRTATAAEARPGDAHGRAQLEALLSRELEPLEKRAIDLGGGFTAEIESAAAPSVREGDQMKTLEIPLGTESSIQCFVYPEPFRPGQSLSRLVSDLRQRADVRAIRGGSVEVLNEAPVMRVDMVYVAQRPAGAALGTFKVLLNPYGRVPLMCVHDEPGYMDTFTRITRDLVLGVRGAPKPEDARYVEVTVTRMGELPLGFDRRSIRSEGAKTVEKTLSLMLVPRSPSEIVASDSETVEESTKDGRITRVVSLKLEEGEETANVIVTGTSNKSAYKYEGTVQGKKISGRFTVTDKAGLLSSRMIAKRIRDQVLSGKTESMTTEEYHAAMNPTGAVSVTYRKQGERLMVQLGELVLDGKSDAEGNLIEVVIPVPGARLVTKREFYRGTP